VENNLWNICETDKEPKKSRVNFFRGKNPTEERDDYLLELIHELGPSNMEYAKVIDLDTNYELRFSDDDSIVVKVLRLAMPQDLTSHMKRVAMSYTSSMSNCNTRAVQTLHIGAKEITPNRNQSNYFNGAKRVWGMDKGNTKEQVVAFLPELLFADQILKIVDPQGHIDKCKIDSKYRLAQTCFTRAAINSSICQLHRDHGVGLDVLLYAGQWEKGHLLLPQFGLQIRLQPGDVVIMDSRIFHEVSKSYGRRYSAVFFTKTHNEVSGVGNSLCIPEELEWLSKKNFGLHIQ